ncbi:hypothetical protein PO587_43505 [Streptomyces gilvifuscus]|uniref:Uncharacterized protein n=1 Tax=Streptomyces gilvifuscus TaxID=1550617 RepID=A0ABT5G8W5_9ACTN|nr:hypothetical protein [Streptomyces gilvifuscus]MDC2961313.1 hypothetical protein [Streptomyces gilvifuscus]
MDPASLSLVAVTLLATKFGEGFAAQAGEGAWRKILSITQAVRERLSRSDAQRAALAELDAHPRDEGTQSAVAAHLRHELETDKDFAARVEALVTAARRDPAAQTLINHASGNAKQAIIGGDNFGPITL